MANEKPNPRLPEPLWHALAKLSHIVSRENTEPPLLHHRCYRSPHSTIDPALRSPNRGNPSQTHALSSSPVANQPSSSSTAPGTCPPAGPASRPCSAPTAIPVTRLARDEGRDVVVVMHAHAGLAGSAGLSGLEKRSASERGWKGGVVRLVYVCAFMFGEGWTQVPPGTGGGLDPDVTVDLARGIYYVHPSHVKAMMYQDVPDAEVAAIAAQLVPQSLAGNWCTSLFAAWRWIPSTYVITLGDQEATVAAEEWIVKSAAESGRCAVDRVVRREVGHCPHWSQAEWMAGLLVEEAERSAR
ncbi:hypothetical protein PMIN02_001834 [Paraphaeosphaeria minitans]